MSVPPQPYNPATAVNAVAGAATSGGVNANSNKAPVEDCRDYLRTGRCKYGASCKYNHPPNVQSGGGMKSPLNPAEPMFPIRPNEPICQYYMKHGTCKFGQACKFHHPPTAQQPQYAAAAVSTSSVLVGLGPGRKIMEPATQLVAVGPPGTDLTHMMVQLLPQRPDEPDCIYFLKNGRCKYGATCRYHHPIHCYPTQSSQPPPPRQPRRAHNDPYSASAKRIPYAQPVGVGHPPGQILVAQEGAPLSLVGGDQATAYKPVTFVTPAGEVLTQAPYATVVSSGTPVFSGATVMTEQGSSASSIASSFDTASSSLDLTGNDAAAAALWSRARKNGSGGSLSAYDSKPRAVSTIPSSASDGNIARRAHSNSLGSAAEYNAAAYAESTPTTGPRHAWRHRSSSFDQQTRRTVGSEGIPFDHQVVAQPPPTGRPPISRGSRQRNSRGPGDEGFTMMTSALLNMLDTQEETSAEAYSEEEGSYMNGGRHVPSLRDEQYAHYTNAEAPPPHQGNPLAMMEQLTLNPTHPTAGLHPDEALAHPPMSGPELRNNNAGGASQWSPTWNEKPRGVAPPHHDQRHNNNNTHYQHPQPPPPPPGHPGHHGLYLP